VAVGLAVANVASDAALGGMILRGGVLATKALVVGQIAARQLASDATRHLGATALTESYGLTSKAAGLPFGDQLARGFKGNFVQVGISETAALGSSLWDFVPFVASYRSIRQAFAVCGAALSQ